MIGASVGAFTTLGFNIWKFHRDERTARCDDFCKAVSELANAAAAYWAKSFDDLREQKLEEAKLQAAQNQIQKIWADYRMFMLKADATRVDALFSDFNDAVTGGDFTVGGRKRDLLLLANVLTASSAIVVYFRQANRESFPFWWVVRNYHTNRNATLDMPLGWHETK